MIVVADTSPLNYLVQIGLELILPELYGAVVVPQAVMMEMRHFLAPTSVAAWIASMPEWVIVREADSFDYEGVAGLDAGEREAILLAQAFGADLILMDERKGRREAKRRGFRVMGTLGVLLAAEGTGLIDAKAAYRKLVEETTFRTSAVVEAQFFAMLRVH